MTAIIEKLLSTDEVQSLRSRLSQARFVPGGDTAGRLGQDLKVKANLQLAPDTPDYKELSQAMSGMLRRNDRFNALAVPRRILPPLFNIYGEGQYYDDHIDAALMGPYPGLRTDLSITVFLSDPDSYDGGDLVIQSPFGEHAYKLPAGDALIYPTNYLHWVTTVTRGQRLAAVTWIESMVREAYKREILVELAELMVWMMQSQTDPDAIKKLEKARLNLLRLWAET